MACSNITQSRHAGFTMIEVLISLLIIVLGLLGLAGLQTRMQQAEFDSYQRVQALILLYDIVDQISVNRETASCFRFTTDTAIGAPFLGTGSGGAPACGASGVAAVNAMAVAAMTEWNNALQGAAETKGGASVGAIVGARGCVSYDATTELLDGAGAVMSGTGIYTVAVAWQGTSSTIAPTASCGKGLYPPAPAAADETIRRAVSTTFRLARLN
ncbi:MAG: type IV pilus modification protein PilV [Acidobacteria bacterium RIFCSPLOWO2_02_FULL_65_29]|nr:MAG: type IV pilus modification protein PilV [Acidobacteria bacterium RIFCSPLOWO2_02_FULL_65_29]